jgi:hypothetical protein
MIANPLTVLCRDLPQESVACTDFEHVVCLGLDLTPLAHRAVRFGMTMKDIRLEGTSSSRVFLAFPKCSPMSRKWLVYEVCYRNVLVSGRNCQDILNAKTFRALDRCAAALGSGH